MSLRCGEPRSKRRCSWAAVARSTAEMLGFAHHCSTPIQMVNGRFDGYGREPGSLVPRPGTPADQKATHPVFDGDHTLAGFEKDVMKVNLEWFDRFLGPVR